MKMEAHVRIRMHAAGLVASIMLPLGASIVPGGPALSLTGVFSIDARASETIVARADVCSWNDVGWQEMSEDERNAWQILGWTDKLWELDQPAMQPPSSSKAWADLSENERAAARRLGYRSSTWDRDNCKNC